MDSCDRRSGTAPAPCTASMRDLNESRAAQYARVKAVPRTASRSTSGISMQQTSAASSHRSGSNGISPGDFDASITHEDGQPNAVCGAEQGVRLRLHDALEIERRLAVRRVDNALHQNVRLTNVILRRHLHLHRAHLARDAVIRVLDRRPEAVAPDQRGGGAVVREEAAQPTGWRRHVARLVGDGALEQGTAVRAWS